MSSTHFEQLQNLLAGGDGSDYGSRRGSGGAGASTSREPGRAGSGSGTGLSAGYGARASGLSQLTDLLLEQSKAAADRGDAGPASLDTADRVANNAGTTSLEQGQRRPDNGVTGTREGPPSQPALPEVVPSSQGSGLDVEGLSTGLKPGDRQADSRRHQNQQQQQAAAAAAVLLASQGGNGVPTVIGPPSQPDPGAPQLLESQGGSQGLQAMLSAAEARLGVPGFLPLSGVDFASSLQSHPEFLGGFVWPLGSLPASLSQEGGGGAPPTTPGPGAQQSNPGTDGGAPGVPGSLNATVLLAGGQHHRLMGPGVLAAAAAATADTPVGMGMPSGAGLSMPSGGTGSGRRSGGRPTRRGPMDEMRQLVRILVKLLPQSAPHVVGGDEAGGGNRISEEQIKSYLEATLGSAPRPTWGVPRGWHVYVAELLGWARGQDVDEAVARRVAKREPGRSWEVVEQELAALGVHPAAWPLPLSLQGVRTAESDPEPQALPVPGAGGGTGTMGRSGSGSAPPDAGLGFGSGAGAAQQGQAGQPSGSRRGSKAQTTPPPGFVLGTASELDTWRHLVLVLAALPGKAAAAPPAGPETAATLAGLRAEARMLLDAALLAAGEGAGVDAAGGQARSSPSLNPSLLGMFQGLQYVPALGVTPAGTGEAGMVSLLGGFSSAPTGLTPAAASPQQQPARGGGYVVRPDDVSMSGNGPQREPCTAQGVEGLIPADAPLAGNGLHSTEDGPAQKKARTAPAVEF